MSRKLACFIATVSVCGLFLAGCGGKAASGDGAPPPPKVEQETDVSLLQVEHPEQFPLVKAGASLQAPSLTVTGVVSPDVAAAFADYRKATADEVLVRKQFDRAQILYDKGAISLNDFQVSEDTASKAKVDVETG